jgi:hypothetical protein
MRGHCSWHGGGANFDWLIRGTTRPSEATMNAWYLAWQAARILRWAFWLGLLAYSVYFISDRTPHFNSFGQLKHHAEAVLFGLPTAAVVAGFLELLFRARVSGDLARAQR